MVVAFLTESKIAFVVADQRGDVQVAVVQSLLDGVAVAANFVEVGFNIASGHDQTAIVNMGQVFRLKVFLPVEGDVAPLYDEVLSVFDGGFDHFTDDGPEVACQLIIVHGSQIRVTATDQSHFQVVDGQVGIMVFL